MRRILYGISGIGNGHSNRELPIIEDLARDCQIMVFAHDDSLRIMTSKFGDNPNVTIVPVGLTFIVGSPTGLNFGATAKSPLNQHIDSYKASFEALDTVISLWGKVDLVISDYEPISAQYAYAYDVPLVTIDQQSKFLYGDLPLRLGGFNYRDEVSRLSMFFPKVEKRIACSFFRVDPREGAEKVMLVPPTIKNSVVELANKRTLDKDRKNILVYISSAKEFPQTPKEILGFFKREKRIRFHLFVPKNDVGQYNLLKADNTVIYPHGDPNFIKVMAKANGIISTAGHSLLSEAMFLSIPVYAIPVEPYEQHLNAWAVSSNGFGVSETRLTDEKLEEFLTNLETYTKNIKADTVKLLRGVGQKTIVDYLRKSFLTERKKVMLFSPPFSGHLNVLKEFINEYNNDFDFRLVITGWKNIQPDLSNIDRKIVVIIERSDLAETDPALWTFPRVCELLDECLTVVKEFQPDQIIYDFFSLEGNLAGRLLQIPYWCSIPAMIGPFTNQDYRDRKFLEPANQKALSGIKEKYGVDVKKIDVEMVSDGFHLPGLINLVWSFPKLTPADFKEGRGGKSYVFVGNLRGDNYEKTDYINRKPLIYFSLGTVVMNNLWNQQEETRVRLTQFVGKLADLWKGRNFQIIFVTQGKKVLDSYPDNWWVYDTVDQVEILSRADLFVTHGGSNSFHEAVMQKVPMIVIPFFGDQLLVSKRVERLGIGISAHGSDNIDTRGSKEFLTGQLALDLTKSIEAMLSSNDYVKNYLNLDLAVFSLKALILGEIDLKEGDLVIGGGLVAPKLSPRAEMNIQSSLKLFMGGEKNKVKVDQKLIDFFATIFHVHILLDGGDLPPGAVYALGDDDYFEGGVQFYRFIHMAWVPVDFEEVRKMYGLERKVHEAVRGRIERVVLASKSPLKIAAVKAVVNKETKINGIDPHLFSDEQLVGMDEIVAVATQRLIAVKQIDENASLYVSIVSGLVQNYHQFVDVGIVFIIDDNGKTTIAKSAGLALPLSATQKARLRGFNVFTVGKILGEAMGSHVYDTDPHSLVTSGKQSRSDLLAVAVKKALEHWVDED